MGLSRKTVVAVVLCALVTLAAASGDKDDHKPDSSKPQKPDQVTVEPSAPPTPDENASDNNDGTQQQSRPTPEDGTSSPATPQDDGGSSSGGDTIDQEIEQVGEDLEDKLSHFWQDSKNKLVLALYNLSEYLPLSVEYAATVGLECDIVQYNRHYYTKAGLIISGAMLFLGVVFSFFGYRLMKVVLFLIGFVAGGGLTYFVVLTFTADLNQSWIPYVAISGSVVVGVICGVITICIYYVGIFLAGAGIGFLITWFVLAAIDIAYFQAHIWVPVLIASAAAVVVGVITLFIQKWFFMLGTAVLGAFKIAWALDYFIELGAMVYYLFLFAEHRAELKPCWYSWTMIPVFAILALAGFLVQALLTGRKYDHRKELRGVCCGLCSKRRRKKVDKSGDYMDLKNVADD